MSGIFISYRRNDSQGSTGRLADALKARFSESEIFRDVDDIEDGVDFVETIDRALASCVALLAVIGPRWISIIDNKGRRRLDDPNDVTRTEIAAALKRNVQPAPRRHDPGQSVVLSPRTRGRGPSPACPAIPVAPGRDQR